MQWGYSIPPPAAVRAPLRPRAAPLSAFDQLRHALNGISAPRAPPLAARELDLDKVALQVEHETRRAAQQAQLVVALLREREGREREEREREAREAEAREAEEREAREKERKEREAKEAKEREAKEAKEAKEREAKAESEKALVKKESEKGLEGLEGQGSKAATQPGFTPPEDVAAQVAAYNGDIAEIKLLTAQLQENPTLKKLVGSVRRALVTRICLVLLSASQVQSVRAHVLELLRPAMADELAYKCLLNIVAKTLVSQAETEVVVRPAAAVPIATLAVQLMQQFPELDYFLSARVVKKCCFVLGHTCAVDTEQGRVRMGWRRAHGKWEPEVKYEERVGGICSVWAVMCRLHPASHPLFSMAAQWRFLARLLNTDAALVANCHFVIVCNWWEASAREFCSVYGRQAHKAVRLALGAWSDVGRQRLYPATTRLEILGEKLQLGDFGLIHGMGS